LPTAPSDRNSTQKRRNITLGVICALTFGAMVGAAYASVPLYKAFCQLTGFDGTTRRAEVAPTTILNKTLLIRFDTNVRDLPWTFASEQASQTVKIGETGLAYFKVTNTSDKTITGRALYNVVPEQAGLYFQKLECFCFSDQTIGPHKTMEFPVVYFVDPKYAIDFETRNKGEVTLSYTFYRAVDAKPAKTASQALGGTAGAGL
jgi:cytochrome c oxidase assembly protein subunit 11